MANTPPPATMIHRTSRSGRPLFRRCHMAPSSCDIATPRACVPAYTIPSGATAIVLTTPDTERMVDSPLLERDHVVPPSCETYTPSVSVPAYNRPVCPSTARLSTQGVSIDDCRRFQRLPSSLVMYNP